MAAALDEMLAGRAPSAPQTFDRLPIK